MTSTIIGMAGILPPCVVTNQDLEARFDPKELASINKMSGILERRVLEPGWHASDLALTAAERLLTEHKVDRSQIDLLLFVSQTPDYRIPTTAAILQHKLGLATSCAAFDVNQACAAFPYGIGIADAMIRAGSARMALLLNADAITSLVHPNDRALVPLHGDAACATLLGPALEGYGFQKTILGTDGAGAHYLITHGNGCRPVPESATHPGYLTMDGPAVFHFAISKVPPAIKAALISWGLTMNDVDLVVLHQANKTMLELIYKTCRVPAEKQFFFIERCGNLSGVACPVAMAEAWRQGRIKPGSRTLFCAFGAGMSWGVGLIRWPEDANAVVAADPFVKREEILSAAL
jgi:3-oxoacyl-[acyl-carrier-protein] synthase-3